MAESPLAPLLRYVHKLAGLQQAEALTDAQLLERFALVQNQAAFAALVRRHGPLVWRVCRRLLPHAQDAEDAWQATFLVLARNAGSIRNPASLASWLHSAAYRLARKTRAGIER